MHNKKLHNTFSSISYSDFIHIQSLNYNNKNEINYKVK